MQGAGKIKVSARKLVGTETRVQIRGYQQGGIEPASIQKKKKKKEILKNTKDRFPSRSSSSSILPYLRRRRLNIPQTTTTFRRGNEIRTLPLSKQESFCSRLVCANRHASSFDIKGWTSFAYSRGISFKSFLLCFFASFLPFAIFFRFRLFFLFLCLLYLCSFTDSLSPKFRYFVLFTKISNNSEFERIDYRVFSSKPSN